MTDNDDEDDDDEKENTNDLSSHHRQPPPPPSPRESSSSSSRLVEVEDKGQPSFYEIAIEKGTDKVTLHTYQDTYQRHLPAERGRRLRLLELGLGCDVGYRAGASYYTWREYYPRAELYFIERDPACADRWRAEIGAGATVVEGDSGDAEFLARFLEEHGGSVGGSTGSGEGAGGFDVVVAAGGHSMAQQIVSLETLWRTVKPGGVYFCEYLEASYLEKYDGGSKAKPGMRDTMVHFLQDMIEDMMYPDPNMEAYHLKGMGLSWPRKVQFDEVESIRHIDCSRQICAITKRAD